jgi:arylsulfatase
MLDGKLHFVYVYTRNDVFRGESVSVVPPGRHVLGLNIAKTGESSAVATLLVDGDSVGAAELLRMWPIYAANAGIRCGENRHAPVSRDYEPPFLFDGEIQRVVVDIDM